MHDRRLIALFGPRGLSSLLFTLLPVFAGVPGAERLFTVACLVVLLSVAVHGGGIALFLRANSATSVPVDQPASGARPLPVPEPAVTIAPEPLNERIEIAEVRELLARGEPLVIVDSRADRSYRADEVQARGAIRIPPDDPVRAATEQRLSHHATLVVYCA